MAITKATFVPREGMSGRSRDVITPRLQQSILRSKDVEEYVHAFNILVLTYRENQRRRSLLSLLKELWWPSILIV